MTPADLLGMAETLGARTELPLGVRTRGAALLARKALEQATREALEARGAGPKCRLAASFLSLVSVLDDPEAARTAYATWHALSEACHHQGYELPPTQQEFQSRLTAVRELVERLAG